MSQEQDEFQKAYDQAVKYLLLKSRTVGEMQEKLQKKKYDKKIVFEVLKELERLDFLNDRRYAEIYVESLKRYKSFGYYGIKNKLHQKKVPTAIIGEVLDEFLTPEDELAVAERFVKKLQRQGRKKYEQIARSMGSKGFQGDTIRQILRDLEK
jgi:regulatory protein